MPCFNEVDRLDRDHWQAWSETHPHVDFVMVDDGSRDGTSTVLRALAAGSDRFDALILPRNQGKAEAVRQGIHRALDRGEATVVGFWDADLATPLDDIDRFGQILAARPDLEIAMGARVKLLGRTIVRNPVRHYFGRVTAFTVSNLLRLPVYDTQCGAKLFRVTPVLRRLFADPFVTRWAFDVEILARWIGAHPELGRLDLESRIVEIPLMSWVDVAGSKLRPVDFARTPRDLAAIAWTYRDALAQRPDRLACAESDKTLG